MLVAVVALFGFNYEPLLWAAIVCCVLNAVDEVAIALILPEWDHDVKSAMHALDRLSRPLVSRHRAVAVAWLSRAWIRWPVHQRV